MASNALYLTSGRLLAQSAIWNFVGFAVPLIVALFAIPLLIKGMGMERFGLLTIVWMSVGYFSLVDLGLGRALTKLVAERLGRGQAHDLGPIIWTALFLLSVLGATGGLLLWLLADTIVHQLFSLTSRLKSEAVTAFGVLAIGLPFVVLTAALIGLLQAYQRFASVAAVRIPLGILTFAGPLVTLQFTPSLIWATIALLAGRFMALIAYFVTASQVCQALWFPTPPRWSQVKSLFHFGGWLTVTNIVGPLMTYLDRFFIASVLNITAMAYYATPYEVLSRIQILPRSIMEVVFPAMSTAIASDRNRMVEIYAESSRVLLLIMLPITSGFFLFSPEGLDLWLGEDFRAAATGVVKVLAVGWTINALARPAFIALQSAGRPDLVAKIHLAELIPYLALLWMLVGEYGIFGAAAAWSMRVLADTLILNELAAARIPELRGQVIENRVCVAVVIAGFWVAWYFETLASRSLLLTAVILVSAALLWPKINRLRTAH